MDSHNSPLSSNTQRENKQKLVLPATKDIYTRAMERSAEIKRNVNHSSSSRTTDTKTRE